MSVRMTQCLPITVTSDTEVESFSKGYHANKHLWKRVMNEQISCYGTW